MKQWKKRWVGTFIAALRSFARVASTAKNDFSLLNNARVSLTVNGALEPARFSFPNGLRFGLFSSNGRTT